MKLVINTEHLGQEFDKFLAEKGLAEEDEAKAIKKVVVAMLVKTSRTQVNLAEQPHASRTQIRLPLDPVNNSIMLAHYSGPLMKPGIGWP